MDATQSALKDIEATDDLLEKARNSVAQGAAMLAGQGVCL